MGMYTEILVRIKVKEDTPEEVNDILEYLFGDKDKPEHLPEHTFFTLSRWDYIGQCCSYYHHPEVVTSIVYDRFTKGREHKIYSLFSRSDIKNYSGEIEEFFDWVQPYVDEEEGTCIGYSWYEENNEPTLIYKK